MPTNHPHLLTVTLEDLRPTQMTVGYAEVQEKKLAWKNLTKDERKPFLSNHCFPGVLGPKGNLYIVDHHHLGMALIEEEVRQAQLIVLKDFSALNIDEFWTVMDHHQWVHPYDAQGHRHELDAIPKKITALTDDPYRSLAGEARRAGAYPKDKTPFTEFLWADFFRRRIPAELLANDMPEALKQALALAHTPEAAHLPGWSGQVKV